MGDERLRELLEEGASVARIAAELKVSRHAVKRQLAAAGLRTRRAETFALARAARDAGLSGVLRTCARHGHVRFVPDARGTYRCTHCSTDAVARRRRKVKATLVAEAGGRCCLCGYDRCIAALAFHHLDPDQKEFGLAQGGLARALSKLREEAAKCVLLCANCHAEVEAGVSALPLRLASDPR